MRRKTRATAVAIAVLTMTSSFAMAQRLVVPVTVGAGFGGYGGIGGYGYGALHSPFPTYNAFNYSQQLYQQQSSLTQQIYQQQQLAIIDQIRDAQDRQARLDGIKQEMFQKYLEMSDTEKIEVRARLLNNYVNLDDRGRQQWQRDAAAQHIIGHDVKRLEGVFQFRAMSSFEQVRFQAEMLEKYQSLSPLEQQAWQSDPIIELILGRDWWK